MADSACHVCGVVIPDGGDRYLCDECERAYLASIAPGLMQRIAESSVVGTCSRCRGEILTHPSDTPRTPEQIASSMCSSCFTICEVASMTCECCAECGHRMDSPEPVFIREGVFLCGYCHARPVRADGTIIHEGDDDEPD